MLIRLKFKYNNNKNMKWLLYLWKNKTIIRKNGWRESEMIIDYPLYIYIISFA